MTTKVIERTEGHYEVHQEHYGVDYVWCPGCVVVECECGETSVLSASGAVCRCGEDHTDLIREASASRRRSEGTSQPLDGECDEWHKKQDEYLRSEHNDRLEWEALD